MSEFNRRLKSSKFMDQLAKEANKGSWWAVQEDTAYRKEGTWKS